MPQKTGAEFIWLNLYFHMHKKKIVRGGNYLTSYFWPIMHVSFLNYIMVFLFLFDLCFRKDTI